MIKFKTTRKQIVNNFRNVIALGYCQCAHLFVNHDAFAYTAGIYGWNADCYNFDCSKSTVFVTGYRPFGVFDNKISEKADIYDKLAELAKNKYFHENWEFRRWDKVKKYLLNRFVKTVVRMLP